MYEKARRAREKAGREARWEAARTEGRRETEGERRGLEEKVKGLERRVREAEFEAGLRRPGEFRAGLGGRR